MVKVKYNGDISPTRIRAKSATLYWTRGEVKDLDESLAEAILKNHNFTTLDKTESKKESKKVEETETEEEAFDFDGDGDVDGDDMSLAGKALASSRKRK